MRDRLEDVRAFPFPEFREKSSQSRSLPICAYHIFHAGLVKPLEQRARIGGQVVSAQESVGRKARERARIALVAIDAEAGIVLVNLLEVSGDEGLGGFLAHAGDHFSDLVLCVISEDGQYRRR